MKLNTTNSVKQNMMNSVKPSKFLRKIWIFFVMKVKNCMYVVLLLLSQIRVKIWLDLALIPICLRYDTQYEEKCETKYETQYEKQCATKYEQECSTKYETEYETKYEEKCETKYETKYETTYEEKCSTRYKTIL